MDRDMEIWRFLLRGKRFFRYGEIKEAFPHLHDGQLSKSLRRLEKFGVLVRHVSFCKNTPINVYLAVDPSNPKVKVRVVELRHWFYAIIEWLDDCGLPTRSVGVDLGELGEYVYSINGELYLKWPEWISHLAEAGKVSFSE